MAKKGKKKQLKRQNVIIGTIAVVVLVAVVAALAVLRGQKMANRETVTLYIATGSDYATVVDSLEAHDCIGNKMVFNTMARIRNYKDNVKGGCYVLKPEDKVWNVLTKLYCGNQDAIRLTINKYRTKRQLCDYIGRRLEMESDTLLQLSFPTILLEGKELLLMDSVSQETVLLSRTLPYGFPPIYPNQI